MNIMTQQGMSPNDLRTRVDRLVEFARAVHGDPGLAGQLETDPRGLLAERGIEIPPGMEVRVMANTHDVFHLVLPPDPNAALADEDLAVVAGGKSASTAGSSGSVSSASSLAVTVGTASTAGTVGSAGTVS